MKIQTLGLEFIFYLEFAFSLLVLCDPTIDQTAVSFP